MTNTRCFSKKVCIQRWQNRLLTWLEAIRQTFITNELVTISLNHIKCLSASLQDIQVGKLSVSAALPQEHHRQNK